MFQSKQMTDFVNPDRYNLAIFEIDACPGIDGYPSMEVQPVRKLGPGHNRRVVQQ